MDLVGYPPAHWPLGITGSFRSPPYFTYLLAAPAKPLSLSLLLSLSLSLPPSLPLSCWSAWIYTDVRSVWGLGNSTGERIKTINLNIIINHAMPLGAIDWPSRLKSWPEIWIDNLPAGWASRFSFQLMRAWAHCEKDRRARERSRGKCYFNCPPNTDSACKQQFITKRIDSVLKSGGWSDSLLYAHLRLPLNSALMPGSKQINSLRPCFLDSIAHLSLFCCLATKFTVTR